MKRGLLVNWALSLGVSFALALALEGGARLLEEPPAARPEVADYLWDWDEKMPGGFYVMKSEAAGWPPWEEFDADGLRDRTRPREKPEGTLRAAVLGDSVTLGAGIRPDQAFPQLLEARARSQGRPLEVMNVALWGWSTRQQRIAWRRIARGYRPDVALLAVCLNDIPELFNNLARPSRWLTTLFARSALVRVVVNAEGREIDSVERLFTAEREPRVVRAMEGFFAEVRALRREVEADGARFALVVFPFRFQVEPGAPAPVVQRRIAEFCRAEGLRCLDLLPALSAAGPRAFVDYDHLSPEGAQRSADALVESGLLPWPKAAAEVVQESLVGPAPGSAVPVADLVGLLRHPDAATRRAAAFLLGRSAGASPLALEALRGALRHDPAVSVRAAAAAAIGERGEAAPGAAVELFDALAQPSEAVRHEAARALARLPRSEADVPRLEEALASPDDYVSAFAAWTLGNLGERAEGAVPALARALERERTEAVVSGALARIGESAALAVPALVAALRSPDADRRWHSARTLGRIGPAAAEAVPPLAAALRDENGAVRQHAARALGRIGPASRSAAADLQRATGDPDAAVRREATLALARLRRAVPAGVARPVHTSPSVVEEER